MEFAFAGIDHQLPFAHPRKPSRKVHALVDALMKVQLFVHGRSPLFQAFVLVDLVPTKQLQHAMLLSHSVTTFAFVFAQINHHVELENSEVLLHVFADAMTKMSHAL